MLIMLALLCGCTALFRSLLAGMAIVLGLLAFLVCLLLFGWWAVAAGAAVLGLGVLVDFAQDRPSKWEIARRNEILAEWEKRTK